MYSDPFPNRFGTDFGGLTETWTPIQLGLDHWVSYFSRLACLDWEKRRCQRFSKDNSGSCDLGPVVFIRFSFSSYLQTSDARRCDKPLAHIFSLMFCTWLMSQCHRNPCLTEFLFNSPSRASERGRAYTQIYLTISHVQNVTTILCCSLVFFGVPPSLWLQAKWVLNVPCLPSRGPEGLWESQVLCWFPPQGPHAYSCLASHPHIYSQEVWKPPGCPLGWNQRAGLLSGSAPPPTRSTPVYWILKVAFHCCFS